MSAQKCGHLISKICTDISRRSHKCTDIFKKYNHILKGKDNTLGWRIVGVTIWAPRWSSRKFFPRIVIYIEYFRKYLQYTLHLQTEEVAHIWEYHNFPSGMMFMEDNFSLQSQQKIRKLSWFIVGVVIYAKSDRNFFPRVVVCAENLCTSLQSVLDPRTVEVNHAFFQYSFLLCHNIFGKSVARL